MFEENSKTLKHESDNQNVELTIIIPHFNTPDYLEKLLDSIPFEESIQVVVIDDKSTLSKDAYEQLKSKEEYQHINFLDNNTDKKGAGVCRNIGIDNALGKWLLFADADDYFVDDFYLKVKKYLDSEKEVIFFCSTSVEAGTNKMSFRHEKMDQIIQDFITMPDRKNELMLRYKLPVPWSKLIRRDIVTSNKIYFDDTVVSNDVMFSMKLGYHMTLFEASKDIIYCVTNNTGSLTKTLSEENFDTRLDVFIRRHVFLKDRLSKKDFKSLDIDGKPFIVMAFQYKLGIKKILWILKKYRKNNVKIVEDIRSLNPIDVLKKIKMIHKKHKANKKHYVYQDPKEL